MATTTTINSKEEVFAVLHKRQREINSLGVEKIGLFGSFVHNRHDDQSDIDLLVEFREGQKTFDHFMELSFLLEEALGRRVELLTLESLSPHIGPRILSEVEYATA